MSGIIQALTVVTKVTAVLLALFVIGLVAAKLKNRATAKKLLQSGKRGGDFIYALLNTSFPKGRLFKRVTFSVPTKDGGLRRFPADIVLVEKGGIFVIRVKNFSGMIENPDDGSWSANTQNGPVSFPNPLEQNRPTIRFIENVLKNAEIFNVPIYNLVVFSGRKATFRYKNEKLLPSEKLIATLNDINHDKFLNQTEITATVGVLKRYVLHPENTEVNQNVQQNGTASEA